MSNKQKAKSNRTARSGAKNQKLPVWAWVGLGVFLVAAIAIAMLLNSNGATETGSLPKEINVTKAAEMRTAGAFILDVREPSEWEEVHIPDATLIPLGELASRVNELPKDQEIVVVCRSGNRSQQGRDILLSNGFTQVTSMAGGMNDWRAQGFPTASGQ